MRKILIAVLVLVLLSTPVFAAPSVPHSNGYAEGYFDGLADGKVKLEEYDGTVRTFEMSDKAVCLIDQREVELKDLRAGMEVIARLSDEKIILLESYSTENPGYIPQGAKVRQGTVYRIDRDQLIIKLPDGSTGTYFTTPGTLVSKKGSIAPLSTLYEGDRVRLYFDETDSEVISRMQIEGDSVIIKDLYKGVIRSLSQFDSVIGLENVEKLENGSWKSVKGALRIPYSEEAPVYSGGSRISERYLKYFTGSTVYMAVNSIFGRDTVERMVIKNRYETTYSDKIDEINWFTGALELSGKQNIGFNDGTVIIKNGRLVDQYSINPLSDAFIVADGRGSDLSASIIYIYNEEINNSNIGQNYIYSGRLDEITGDKVYLKDFFLMDKNDWVSFDTEKELYYDNNTYIYDLDGGRALSPLEFFSGDYAVDGSSSYAADNNLKDWYGYIYTDGDRISGIFLKKHMDSLLAQRVTTGKADSLTDDPLVGWTAEIGNSADWSSRKEKWMGRSVPLRISIDRAMVIKDGAVVDKDRISAGDRLYILRDGFEAKVVIIK